MDENTVRDALAAGSALSEPRFVGIGAYAVVPEDYELISLEPYAESPTRKHGSVEMHDVDSFIRYFNAHAAEHSQIYATVNPPRFVGVLNDHEQKKAGWRDFCVTYNCPISIEWREWAECDGKPMKQVEFADFIERNLPD